MVRPATDLPPLTVARRRGAAVLPCFTFGGLPEGALGHIQREVVWRVTESAMDRRGEVVNSVLTTMNTTTTRCAGNVMK